ncbi:MAG TPA: hypothetical protein ENO00_13960 [Deltaproteobacteria bacterium]|nr:hypothetical protein [Deltaproteobacteria bacterium]
MIIKSSGRGSIRDYKHFRTCKDSRKCNDAVPTGREAEICPVTADRSKILSSIAESGGHAPELGQWDVLIGAGHGGKSIWFSPQGFAHTLELRSDMFTPAIYRAAQTLLASIVQAGNALKSRDQAKRQSGASHIRFD